MVDNKALSMISLCKKAGKIMGGSEAVFEAIQSGKAYLVIIASDSSENTKKQFVNNCTYYGVDYIIFATKEELGHFTGSAIKAALAITDQSFSESIKRKIEQ